MLRRPADLSEAARGANASTMNLLLATVRSGTRGEGSSQKGGCFERSNSWIRNRYLRCSGRGHEWSESRGELFRHTSPSSLDALQPARLPELDKFMDGVVPLSSLSS